MKVSINSQFTIGTLLPTADEQTIKREPMLHRADREFAMRNGGLLTRLFLVNLPWTDVVVDSRVHMLMPGMYPCIPGWHHDDVPRSREDGQPEYLAPSYRAEHCMALWGDCAPTEFAIGEHQFEVPPVGQKIYKTWEPVVERLCLGGVLNRQETPEARLIFFDWNTWHRGVETKKLGFRFFIRATRNTGLKPRNEIRFNANVYMPVLEEGW